MRCPIGVIFSVALVTVACSSTPRAEPATAASTTVGRPTPQTLPGESLDQAMDRILRSCYAEVGVTVGPTRADGGMDLSAATPEVLQSGVEECQQRLEAAGLQGDFPLTAEEIRANYDRIALYRQCIRDHGYNIGETMSFEEFSASGGTADIFAGIPGLMDSLTQAQGQDLMAECPQG